MRGKTGVESVVGEGSTFWIELKEAETPLHALHAQVSYDDGPLSPGAGTVLYIEDNLPNLELVERILAKFPAIELRSATRGEEGLAIARERRPNMILLDLHLPDLRGDEVLRRLRADRRTERIPVVMLSADATADQPGRLMALGAQGYLTKPIDFREFLTVIGKTLKSETLSSV
jgi:CheY-like chemotaxis protein